MTLISGFFPTGFPLIPLPWTLNTQMFDKSTNLGILLQSFQETRGIRERTLDPWVLITRFVRAFTSDRMNSMSVHTDYRQLTW